MELIRVSDRIWYSMYEEKRDRPCLGYVRGDRWSLAVDAGHSDAHVREFYEALEAEQLPLPSLTVITHWHWDHSFGMHCIHGLSMANTSTNNHLTEFAARLAEEGPEMFFSLDPSIRKEYSGSRPVRVVPADLVFEDQLQLDMGGVRAILSRSISPHTDDTTLVHIPEERFLFVGDCPCGEFPDWIRDHEKTHLLKEKIREIDVDRCLGGHWPLQTKQELLMELEDVI